MSDPGRDHELHTLSGAYALDAIDDLERAGFERHLASCPSCQEEVTGLRAVAVRLATAATSPAPQELRARVLSQAAQTRQVSPSHQKTSLTAREARRWYAQPVAAAAAFLLVVAVGLGAFAVDQRQQARDARTLADRVASVIADPGHTERTVDVAGGGSATVVSAGGLAVVRATLPRLDGSHTYQLWRLGTKAVVSAGLLGGGGDVTGIVQGVARGDSVGVTVEPAGGSSAPSTTPVALVGLA